MSDQSYFSEIHDPAARVRALCDYGCKVDVDPSIPPKRYFRSGLEMIRMANVYAEEGNYESAFILYSKYISLFVEKLPQHPDYKSCPATDRQMNKKKVMSIFPIAEIIKQKLKEKYEVEEKRYREEERKKQEIVEKEEAKKRQIEEDRMKAFELQRQMEEEDLKKKYLTEQQEQYRILQEKEKQELEEKERQRLAVIAGAQVPIIQPGQANNFPPISPPSYDAATAPGYPVAVPSSEFKPNVLDSPISPSAPPGPGAVETADGNTTGRPSIDRSKKPSLDHFTSVGQQGSNKYGFKDVIVPANLMVKFVNLARPNTERNVETCGILAGKLSRDCFVITNLVIPNQSGTPDSCTTDNEDELFDYQDAHDLITLGWIHTHPTQTAFMSSVDLHTHCSYQLMMPEAIAIVCSPKYQETGMFSLTPDYGRDYIANCRKTGFHPHPKDPPLYETSPHVKIDETKSIEVADLRHNKTS
ncbi:STAM-binding protein-like A isoform X2 [Lineus longissimus]